ncbi:IS30 family transposase [Ruegeria atlantica]|uniref:Transposase, IS30 family n=1 Tax=Ruegeria atlantica TaxID=81569 RepID=A0A0P1EAT9_9RHOB|nr:IS30 family transposase [Ruegeria atlantica]CUH46538.1 Transposase, IS30 family [Ruegeria atlantica]CUH46634.1 Transposase, IS30 family [Ruegeria atlantica]CUH48861.1 Transposase, IS30 family [Ruegeria atlantica]
MAYRRRIYFTEKQKAEIWDRWQCGESMSSIGRLFDRGSSSIYPLLARTGGIRPPERRRSRWALTTAEREEISRGLGAELSVRTIARQLRRSPSTISREVRRNGGRQHYRATQSDQAAWERARRPKPCKLAERPALCHTIAQKLERKWSPQQIAGWLKREHPDDEGERVSHETIYRSLFIQARGVLKKELLAHLRATRAIRRSRHASLKRDGLGQIKDAISIRERPAAVEDRAIPGHWEGDLIAGSKNSFIATLVERRTRYVMLVKVGGKETQTVVAALTAQIQHLPRELRQTLTWDRGKELADHKNLALATDLDIYFCDPHSPWQRGTNENTNRLLRQYFPKGTDLSVHSQEHLDAVARELNERPRKTLHYFSPAETFHECVAAIG